MNHYNNVSNQKSHYTFGLVYKCVVTTIRIRIHVYILLNSQQGGPDLIHLFEGGGGLGECDGQQLIGGGRGGGGGRRICGGGHRIDFDGTSALYILLVF